MLWHLFAIGSSSLLSICNSRMKLEDCEGPWVFDGEVSQPNGDVRPPPLATHTPRSRSNRTVWTSTALCETPNGMWRNCLPSPCRASARWQRQEGKPRSPVNGCQWCSEMGEAKSCFVWICMNGVEVGWDWDKCWKFVPSVWEIIQQENDKKW